MKLEEAIQQESFSDERIKAGINIYYTSSQLNYQHNLALKSFNLSLQQFNILRILRGQKGVPIAMKDVSCRMIDKMSNASRLVEKLRLKGLIERTINEEDRRSVAIVITEAGMSVLEDASREVEACVTDYLDGVQGKEIEMLNTILDKINE